MAIQRHLLDSLPPQLMRLDNYVHDAANFADRIVFIPICTRAELKQIFETMESMSMKNDAGSDLFVAPLV
jgi:hypothetical protein